MSRRAEFHGARLFHGTDQEFAPGDVIEPRDQWRGRDYLTAYATDKVGHARHFGQHVYEVSPVDPDEHLGGGWMDQYDDEPRMREYTSAKGFTVVRKVRARRPRP